MTADEIVRRLALSPHPEGGWYRETFRDPASASGRPHSTAILFLLAAGQRSAWHRVRDAAELWHFHAGAALRLMISTDGRTVEEHRLGPDLAAGDLPQRAVPAGAWQSAETTGAWTLVGCTVAPAFDFAAFELAAGDRLPGAQASPHPPSPPVE